MTRRLSLSLTRTSLLASWLIAGTAMLTASSAVAEDQLGYLQFPAHNGETAVFSAEGDLWTAPLAGGAATRLTSSSGSERLARYSPDGEWLAFTASYEGNGDVYVMPAAGGAPRRITFTPGLDEVVGWSADGDAILFRTRGGATRRSYEIDSVPFGGGIPTTLPVGTASLISIHEDGRTVAFNRTGRFYRTWKRYGGGTNEDLWFGDLRSGEFRQVTTFHGTDNFPMWVGDRVFFVSDRTGFMNLWSLDRDGADLRQHTFHEDADVRWPAEFGGRIIYHLLGDLWLFDAAANSTTRLAITLPSDRSARFTDYSDPGRFLTEIAVSWDGERVAAATRGNVFAMPARRGRVDTISADSAWRVKDPSFSPDGETIAAWTTASGEEALTLFAADGKGEPRTLTNDETGFHFAPIWSPDGESVAYSDEEYRVWIIDVETGDKKLVDQARHWEVREYTWSADSRWLAYTRPVTFETSQVWVHDTETGEKHAVTDPLFNSWGASFDPEGEYLFFLSRRTIAPVFSDVEFETAVVESTKPYFVILKADGPSFLIPDELAALPLVEAADDEAEGEDDAVCSDCGNEEGECTCEKVDDDNDSEDDDSDEDKEEEAPAVTIDFDGLFDRTFAIPTYASNYDGLIADDDGRLFFLESATEQMSETDELFDDDTEPGNILHAYHYGAEEIEDREVEEWIAGITSFQLAPGGEHLFYRVGGDYYLTKIDGAITEHEPKTKLDLGRLSLKIDPAAEWAQILHDAYLFQREFYYAPNMAGTDWEAVYARYKALLPRIATRTELNDIIGQMIAELGTGHTYVWGGGDVERGGRSVSMGHLGADLEWNADAGAWRVAKVYRGYAWDGRLSPLMQPNARVREGDLIHAIDGVAAAADLDPSSLLINMAGKVVELDTSRDGTDETRRTVFVEAIGGDFELRYLDWVEDRRAYVAAQTDGEFGYLHIPDMGGRGLVMFLRYYFPQLSKKALVIDARFNGGGFVSQLIINRLSKQVIAYGTARNSELNYTYPDAVFRGPLVVLTNESAGSDGDIFPEAVQLRNLGPVIGTRTWGGVIGIRGDKRFVDRGMTTQPEFAWWDTRRGWSLENEGVYPDIEVQITPEDELAGRDPQLDRGISELRRMLEQDPERYAEPTRPPFPDTWENWRRRAEPFLTTP
jgi:tricorn protease